MTTGKVKKMSKTHKALVSLKVDFYTFYKLVIKSEQESLIVSQTVNRKKVKHVFIMGYFRYWGRSELLVSCDRKMTLIEDEFARVTKRNAVFEMLEIKGLCDLPFSFQSTLGLEPAKSGVGSLRSRGPGSCRAAWSRPGAASHQ